MDSKGLNPAQRQAVEHGDGPALVVAGAGTGKTAVITRRIAHLITSGRAEPQEILALTFTDKAAGEMLDRLDGLVGWQAYQVSVMTFHAFGAQLLQRFGHHIGRANRAQVLPSFVKLLILKQHFSEVELSYYGHQTDITDFLAGVVEYIEALQNADIDLKTYIDYVEKLRQDPAAHALDVAEADDRRKLYELYEQLKQRLGFIDYHDQIMLPLQLLRERPNVAERLRQQYRYVLVDEYQDTNAAQDALVRSFVPPDGNIFAVGDDDQAIYGFRGARLENILEFADHFKVAKPIVLTENYRSTQPILDAAYRLIQHNNPDRLEERLGVDKHLHAQADGGPAPRFIGFATPPAEQEGVAELVAAELAGGKGGKVAAEDIAVLATSHASLKSLARALRKKGIQYRLSSSVNIFEQPELLQLWHLLHWVGLDAGDESIAHVLMGPLVGWSTAAVRQLVETAGRQLQSLEQALGERADKDKASGDSDNAASAAAKLVADLAQWRDWAKTMPTSQLVYKLIFESELNAAWIAQAEESPRMVRLFEDLQLLLGHMQQFESVALDPKLAGYLGQFPRPPEIETEEVTGDEHGVALLTVHASKGLEFDTVIIMNNTHDAWGERASGRGVQLPDELVADEQALPPEHERRRLLYVALTRAKRQLILTAPTLQASGRQRKLSPFLAEIFEPAALQAATTTEPAAPLQETLKKLQRFNPSAHLTPPDRLPFEAADGWIELSVTDIDSYDRCPFEFYIERVLKIRTPTGPQIQFGSLLHDLFHDYYLARQHGETVGLDELQHKLQQRWSIQGYRTPEEAATDQQRAGATLTAFYQREQAADRTIRSTEESFRLSLPDAKLRIKGKIDVSFTTPEGIEVRDFKTGRKRDADKLAAEAKKNLQLRTYALAIQEMTGAAPARVVLDYIVTGTEGEAELSARILQNHRDALAKIAEQIRRRHFEPNPSPFHNCAASKYWGSADDDA